MDKVKFIKYISIDNKGFYKTRKGHIKKVAPNLLNEIENFLEVNDIKPLNFSDGIKYFLNDSKSQFTCKVCDKSILHQTQYCSNKCKKTDIQSVLNKSRNTLKKKYGSTSPLSAPGAKEKAKQTCLKNHGVEHALQSKKIQKKSAKTSIKNYGVPNPTLSKKIKNKISNKLKNAYLKNKDEILEKRKDTNKRKYGERTLLTSFSIENAKKTLLNKYGTTNPFAIHDDTYLLAGKGSIDFFGDPIKKKQTIESRIDTINEKYGSLKNMNKLIFQKRKKEIIDNLKRDGINEEVLKYSYDKLGFVKCKGSCGHEYDISLHLLRNRHYAGHICCTKCSSPTGKSTSNTEKELYDWLNEIIPCERNVRNKIKGEIDVFIPSMNIGIEFNGIYWHSDLYKDKNYHLNKTLLCKEKGIHLLHVWEDLWKEKKNIIKSRILSQLNINSKNIGARKCSIVEISHVEARIFSNENHLQGFRPGYKHYGLKYEGDLVYYISVSKRKLGKSKDENFEILRSCSKLGYNIQGGFSKLFKYIKEELKGDWVTYSDLCWGEGKVYEKAGFVLEKYSKPSYWYFINSERFHRYTYRKSELIRMGYDSQKTEFQIMNEDVKALRIYDCGNAVWKLKKQ